MNTQINTAADRERIGDKITIVRRGKRGTWIAEFHHHGQHRHRSLKTVNIKIARKRALLLEAELVTGDYAPPAKPMSTAHAVKEFMLNRKSEARAVKTLAKYQTELDLFVEFLSRRGVHTLQSIVPSLFDQYRAERSEDRSAKTVFISMMIIKTLIRWCVNRSLLERDPLRSCRVTRPYVPPKRTPTKKEALAILQAAKGQRQIQLAVLAYAGIRAGEMQMLRLQDVDLKNGWINIVAHGSFMPKTRQARRIPIHPKLRKYLDSMPQEERPYYFVAPPSPKYPKGDHHIDIRTLNEDFKKLAKSLDMPVGRKKDGFVTHSLRHFFETAAVDSGTPQFQVDAWLGHAGVALMGKNYYGFTDEKSQAYMQNVKF